MSHRHSTPRFLLRATALALTLAAADAALAQNRDPDGLRGSGMPGSGENLLTPSGTADRSETPLTGATNAATAPRAAPVDLTAPNYGKPRKRPDPRAKYQGQRKTPLHALPALAPYGGAATARQLRATPSRSSPPTPIAAIPTIPAKARPKVDTDPYAAIGIGVGSLRLVPYVDVQSGYDTNPNRVSAPAKGSPTLRGEIGAAWQSDWSVHDFKGDIKAGYTKYIDAPLASRPDAQGKMNLRIDATRDTALDFELRGQLDTQRPGSAELTPTGIKNRPLVASVGATAGATQKFGDLELGLHGTLDRTSYEDATLNNGTKLLLSGNSYNTYGLRGRAGYQITPGVTPFIEVGGDVRRHDEAIDGGGFARNSGGVTAKVGSTFELTRQLTGEASVGYAQRKYTDARLPALGGPTFDAALVWAATPLTTVALRGTTSLNESTIANASGAVSRAVTLDVSHALLRNMTIGAVGTLGVNDYKGVNLRENTLSAGLRAEYKFNRSLSIRGSFTHERLTSSAPGNDYTANVFLLGLKFQR